MMMSALHSARRRSAVSGSISFISAPYSAAILDLRHHQVPPHSPCDTRLRSIAPSRARATARELRAHAFGLNGLRAGSCTLRKPSRGVSYLLRVVDLLTNS